MSDKISVLLSTTYFGPIQYYSKFLKYPVVIEKHENYSKQSYRNRCVIYGANSPLSLVVPVKNNHRQKTIITNVLIDYDTNWRDIHLRSIESAYRSAPFYEFYADEIIQVFKTKYKYLFDLNQKTMEIILKVLEVAQKINFTDSFRLKNEKMIDFRNSIHPKKRMIKPDKEFEAKPYNQVFSEKHGFKKNLSIIDLIFNEGPLSKRILYQSFQTP